MKSAEPVTSNEVVQCIHIPDGSVVISGELFDQIPWMKQCLDANVTEASRLRQAFKNFHRLLCERFGYGHDEVDWERDQLSLIEWIAKRGSSETLPVERSNVSDARLQTMIDKPSSRDRHEAFLELQRWRKAHELKASEPRSCRCDSGFADKCSLGDYMTICGCKCHI